MVFKKYNRIISISSAQDAKDFLEDLQSKIRIQFNAGKKLDEIIFTP